MKRESNATDLLVLLPLSILETGCPEGDILPEDTGSMGSNGADTGTEHTSSGGAPSTTSSGGTGSSGGVDTSGDVTVGTTGERECGEFPVEVGEISEACIGYVEVLTMCYFDSSPSPECIAYQESACQYEFDYSAMLYGERCASAYEDFFVCISQLTCEEFSSEGACAAEGTAVMTNCM